MTGISRSCHELVKQAKIQIDRCDLFEAQQLFSSAFEIAKIENNPRAMIEALSGLVRIARESCAESDLEKLLTEIETIKSKFPDSLPPLYFYCVAILAGDRGDWLKAQKLIRKMIRVSQEENNLEDEYKGWIVLIKHQHERKKFGRALWLSTLARRKFGDSGAEGLNGYLSLARGWIYLSSKDYEKAAGCFQSAHESFLQCHNWLGYLYVLFAYANYHRVLHQFAKSEWYLGLLDKAAVGPSFTLLRSLLLQERKQLSDDSIDLVIDSHKSVVRTREHGEVTLGKQHVLIRILKALSSAHEGANPEKERGLSKSDLIESVWRETYSPNRHDNKLYFNINRIRKLIEPNMREPKYLQNWKEGYRFTPGLKIQFIGTENLIISMKGQRE